MPEPYTVSSAVVVDRLQTNVASGLDDLVVDTCRTRYGWNQLPTAQPVPTWKKFLSQFTDLVIWILIVAAIIAGLMGEWVDTVAILAIVVLNGVLGFIQEEKAGKALAALRAMASPMSRIRRNGVLKTIPAREIVPGDIVLLEAGDNVPADARLIDAFSVTVQEASLTGESVPAKKDAGKLLAENTPLGDRENSLYMGTVLASGKATAVVTAIGEATELGQIAGMLHRDESEVTPLQRRLAELGRILVVVCLIMVSVIFTIEFARGGELMETLLVAVSLAVAAVPEGLPAVVTIALALGLQRMIKQNALIRKLPSVETLGSVTVICSDKTGTLTRNEMTVREIWAGDEAYQVTGVGYEPSGEFLRTDVDALTEHETKQAGAGNHRLVEAGESSDLIALLTIAAVCNSANLVRNDQDQTWHVVGDPTEGALIVVARKAGIDLSHSSPSVVSEIPFDSERKAMSVIVQADHESAKAFSLAVASNHDSMPSTSAGSQSHGWNCTSESHPVMYTKGAPEVILNKSTHELFEGRPRELTSKRRKAIQQRCSEMADRALRVLGFAYRDAPELVDGHYQESELVFIGVVGMIDPPRDEVKTAVDQCHVAGIRPVMITGDHPATALAIGRELQIANSDSRAITGQDLDEMSDEQLLETVDQISVYARVSAAHKLRVVKAWKARGQVVAMTGDGVNDAPAVQAADIGIAMGITGTDVTKEAADMVLTDDNFASIVAAIKEGRGIFDNIQKFVHYLLSCNAGEVILMFAAALLGMPLPLIAIQILWINLVTDGLPALALAMEPPERDIMQRQPRPPREPVITWQRGLLILYHGSLIGMSALFGFWWVYADDPANIPVARTTAFAITAFSQLAFALVCRSQRFTLPQLGLFSNHWLLVAFAASGLLQILVLSTPLLQGVFAIVSMTMPVWLLVIGMSLAPATVIELAKIAFSFRPTNSLDS